MENSFTRRSFGRGLLLSGSMWMAGSMISAAEPLPRAGEAAAPGDLASAWPAGYDPATLGKAVGQHFANGHTGRSTRITYPEVCTWYGALELVRITADAALQARLVARFEPFFSTESAYLPPKGEHVDFSMFGGLPLEIYMLTREERYRELGLSYADAQWAKADAQGLTAETRFWVDDMFMITFVQVQAYRATGEKKYLDRAAVEMAAYLDKLEQANGLFYHALDVPFFWGRGNGWFAVGMSEMLREVAVEHPQRARILRGYRTMMASLLRYQGADGMWRQLIDRPESWPESSCSGMFAAALITGVRHGWLEKDLYEPAARKAWIGLAGYVDQDFNVTSVCEGTNKLNSYEYYMLRKRRTGDLHGQAPLLWSAAALLRQA